MADDWLSSLFAASPFGALGGASNYSGPTGNIGYGTGVGATGPIPATPPQASGGVQLPGIWGKLLGQQQGQPGQQGQGQQQGQPGQLTPLQQWTLSQAMGLIQPRQIQPPSWMNLLSGPGAR